jgi:osomolarity two-component system response regulator SKN7
MSSTSDFVKKLYKMLEDHSCSHIVSWGPQGDCFVVKDMNEFTKSILPRMFKHSNFASFVRQLNKYDFHKVKNADDNQFGEHSWTFRHPDFRADRRDSLENIKRKIPAQRKSTATSAVGGSGARLQTNSTQGGSSGGPFGGGGGVQSSVVFESLQAQVERLTQSQEEMSSHMRLLERHYHEVVTEMGAFQRSVAQQDQLMQNLILYFMQQENGKWVTSPCS